jgi:Tol biopolymer transport system component
MNMKIKNHTTYPIACLFLMVLILSTCEKKPSTLTQISITSTNSATPIPSEPVNTSTPLPKQTATRITTTYKSLQITYSDYQNGVEKIYAIPFDCPESIPPCKGEPKLLLEFNSPIYSLNWSPDGKKVVFEALGLGGKNDVFIADWNGENLINLTHSSEYEGHPIWSPDGKQIGYIGCGEGNCNFISIKPDGSNPIRSLTKIRIALLTAVWSPNGNQILFSGSIFEPFDQIYLSNLDGSNLIKLTNDETGHYSQIFSPDGDLIAFVRTHNPEEVDWSDIFLIYPDGSGEINLTNGLTTFQSDIAWAPIGNWIAFSGSINNKYNIYLIHPNGMDFIKLTEGDGNIGTPAWRLSYTP